MKKFVRSALAITTTVAALTAGLPAFAAVEAQATQVQAAPGVDDFVNIVALSNCSASVVRLKQTPDTAKAWMMTNGHCSGQKYERDLQFYTQKPQNMSGELLTASGGRAGTLKATTLVYGTMYGTDLAIYELTETYAELERKYQIKALTISEAGPKIGDKVVVNSGYWKTRYNCTVDALPYGLISDASQPMWQREAARYTHDNSCRTKGGTSGSPVVDRNTGEVVVINNSGNDKSVSGCTKDDTCEVDENGRRTSRGPAGYGTPTYWLYTCAEANGSLNLKKPGCKLPGGDSTPKRP